MVFLTDSWMAIHVAGAYSIADIAFLGRAFDRQNVDIDDYANVAGAVACLAVPP